MKNIAGITEREKLSVVAPIADNWVLMSNQFGGKYLVDKDNGWMYDATDNTQSNEPNPLNLDYSATQLIFDLLNPARLRKYDKDQLIAIFLFIRTGATQ